MNFNAIELCLIEHLVKKEWNTLKAQFNSSETSTVNPIYYQNISDLYNKILLEAMEFNE
jgi:hypothetical protein